MPTFDDDLRQVALADVETMEDAERAHLYAALGLHYLTRQGMQAMKNGFAVLGMNEYRLRRLIEAESQNDPQRYLGFLKQFTNARAQCWAELYQLATGEQMPSEMKDSLLRDLK